MLYVFAKKIFYARAPSHQYLKPIPIPAKGSCAAKRGRTQILSSPPDETQKHSYPPSFCSTRVGRLLPRAPPARRLTPLHRALIIRPSRRSSLRAGSHLSLPRLARSRADAVALGSAPADPAGGREGRPLSSPPVGVSTTTGRRTNAPARQEEPTYRSRRICLSRVRRRLSASRVRGRRKCIVCLPIPLEPVLEGQKHCADPFCVHAYSVGDSLIDSQHQHYREGVPCEGLQA